MPHISPKIFSMINLINGRIHNVIPYFARELHNFLITKKHFLVRPYVWGKSVLAHNVWGHICLKFSRSNKHDNIKYSFLINTKEILNGFYMLIVLMDRVLKMVLN